MAVPTFQTWFVPLLKRVSDGKVHTLSELYAHLADDLQLSEADRAETLANGKTRLFRNRIAWARTYLQKAGLVNAPGRAQCQITERGLKALAQNPDGLKVKYLKQFPEFREFHTYKKPKGDAVKPAAEDDDANGSTPEELLSQSHLALKESVTQELLERLKTVDPTYFESIVLDLLLKMGYGGSREDAGMTLGGSGDGGLDGVINEDRLGLDVVYIQAKRWENTVQRPTVQAFAGSLEGVRASKGVMITTSGFSSGAHDYVTNIGKRIVLVDGVQLANLMFEHNLGVSPVESYEVKRLDTDYFEET